MGFLGFMMEIFLLTYLFLEAPKHGLNRWFWAIAGFFFGFFALAVFMLRTDRIGLAVLWFVLGLIDLVLYLTPFHL